MPDARWIAAGEVLRRAFRGMSRMDVDDYPVRIDWPPRVASGTAPPGPSRSIKARLQMLDMRRIIDELQWQDYEAWIAVDLIDVRHRPMATAEVALQLDRRAVHRLLRERAWPFIAERLLRNETE